MKKVETNSTVTVNYTGRLEDGSVFDSSNVEGREPLKATLGQGQLIKGFEDGLLEMIEGDHTMLEREPMEKLVEINQLQAFKHDGFWQCMDTKRDHEHLEAMWEKNEAPWV